MAPRFCQLLRAKTLLVDAFAWLLLVTLFFNNRNVWNPTINLLGCKNLERTTSCYCFLLQASPTLRPRCKFIWWRFHLL